ncbi:MAG: thioredoxin-disulfide reductase [Deltaproteobacteria bacterium RIFOXYD12_FULL_55_16]|nr:MAG: thioredoxin-disulfide reductase [Deltaproteobacteria bacterium RIFOXYD12_FULL_55_16]
MHDLIIIGGGPGGYTAGIYARRAALKTVLIEKGLPGGQLNNTDEVENWPGTEKISGAELALNFARHAAVYGLEVMNREVVAIAPGPDQHTVTLDNGETLAAHAVILATGGSPKKLGIPGEDRYYGRGVSYCAVCDGFFFRDKTVVVAGGGDSALEEALYLAKLARQVYIAHRRDAFRAGMILQQRVRQEKKISVLWNTALTEIQADAQGVNGVSTQNTLDGTAGFLATDGVFVFIGFAPNNSLVPTGTRLNANGYVLADDRCETSTPGLFAVGDLKEKYTRQIVTAAADGCTAALAAAHYVASKKAGLP